MEAQGNAKALGLLGGVGDWDSWSLPDRAEAVEGLHGTLVVGFIGNREETPPKVNVVDLVLA
jgi:hypothetical protein